MAPQLIFLWSTRRTLSTAFQKAIYQLDGVKHFCEPFALPHYFGSERKSVLYVDNQDVASKHGQIPTNAERLTDITAEYPGYHKTFIKEHVIFVWPDIMGSKTHVKQQNLTSRTVIIQKSLKYLF